MKDVCIGILMGLGVSLVVIAVVFFFIFCSYFGSIKAITSSPVEEMYHKQLVITLDSILDSRFGSGCCEESIDIDSTYTKKAGFRTKFVPIE